MAKDPAFLFYPNDWLGGTMGMTFEQKGAYMELLMMQFNHGQFTEAQAKQVLSICFDYAWPMLLQKFQTDGVYYWNERLRAEIEKRRSYSESRRNNGSGKKQDKHMQEHMDNHMDGHMENEDIIIDGSNVDSKEEGMQGEKPSKGEKKKTQAKKEPDFIGKLLQEFQQSYAQYMGVEYDLINEGKDRAAIGRLLNIYKKKNPGQSSEETILGFRSFFDLCNQVDDAWLLTNMSPSIIASKLNEIKNKIRNGNKRVTGHTGATDRELAEVIAKHFGQ